MDLKKSFSDLDIRIYTLEVVMPNSHGEPQRPGSTPCGQFPFAKHKLPLVYGQQGAVCSKYC